MFSLDPAGVSHEADLAFFDSDGAFMELDPFDSQGAPLGSFSRFRVTIPPQGSVVVATSKTGPLKAGYALFAAFDDDFLGPPGFQPVGVNAVITKSFTGQPEFRTSVPGLPVLQERLRLHFSNAGGFNTCVAWNSDFVDESQNITIIARGPSGQEMCRSSSALSLFQHEAFCLADRLPCVPGQHGMVEIAADGGGIAAIGLAADPSGRLWTLTPYEVVGITESCAEFPQDVLPFEKLHRISKAFRGLDATGTVRPHDRLVTGRPSVAFRTIQFGIPDADFPDQRFCGLVELVPGFEAEVYVPTRAEKRGDFSTYAEPIIIPSTGRPFADNQIIGVNSIFVWRIRLPPRRATLREVHREWKGFGGS